MATRLMFSSLSPATSTKSLYKSASSLQRSVSSVAPVHRIGLQQQPELRSRVVLTRASSDDKPVNYSKEFGYSRKDVILIGVGLTAVGYAMYYGLQATGMEAGYAGNWVQLIMTLGMSVGWVSSYLFRVATKQMTYVKQLEAYEDAVMKKRLEEMTEDELAELVKQAEEEKARAAAARAARKGQ